MPSTARPPYALGAQGTRECEPLSEPCRGLDRGATRLLDRLGVRLNWRAVGGDRGPLGVLGLVDARVGPDSRYA